MERMQLFRFIVAGMYKDIGTGIDVRGAQIVKCKNIRLSIGDEKDECKTYGYDGHSKAFHGSNLVLEFLVSKTCQSTSFKQ